MATEKNDTPPPMIALGVTGCIGAYKAPDILRRLQDQGYEIQPILTRAAQNFISPLTFQALAGRSAITGLFDNQGEYQVRHIAISDQASVLLVAPATANIIGKFARGIADDFLSTIYLSSECPIVIAPAMNTKMWRHPATQENAEILESRGVQFVKPGVGYLACGWEGEGRLAAVEHIVDAVGYALCSDKSLDGQTIVITAGPTVENIDPIRYISNRSSGRMGTALAAEAKARGAQVTLISGVLDSRMPYGVEHLPVHSADDMFRAVDKALPQTTVLIMAAAVSDYRPRTTEEHKIKKSSKPLNLELEPVVDILAEIGKKHEKPLLVGFAAESQNLRANAARKLQEKGADIIVANPIGGKTDVMGTDDTEGIILTSDGQEKSVPRCSKVRMSKYIFDEIEKHLGK